MTTGKEPMHTIDASHEFDAPAHSLWALLSDFGNIERWWLKTNDAVRIEHVVLTGTGVGLTRHIYNVGMPAPISERLDALDPVTRTYTLSIIGERPVGMTSYQATGHVADLPGKRCRLDYHAEFTTGSGVADDARAFLHLVYGLMFEGLGATLAEEQIARGQDALVSPLKNRK
jgi:hypothetical protein